MNILNFLTILLYHSVKLVLLGDFQQLLAVCDYFFGKEIKRNSFEHSNLLHNFAGGNHVMLTKCRRSNPQLFKLYTNILPRGSNAHLTLQQQISLARTYFPRESHPTRFNICISHARRKHIIKLCYEAAARLLRLPVHMPDETVQEIYCGCPIISAAKTKNLINGKFLEVISIDELIRLKV